MSHENVELARKAFEAYRIGGVEAGLMFFAPDTVSYTLLERHEEAIFRGRDGVRRIDAIWRQDLDGFVLEIHEIRDLDERVLLLGEMTGRAKANGAQVRRPIAAINSDFRGGMIGETRFFASWQQAIEVLTQSG